MSANDNKDIHEHTLKKVEYDETSWVPFIVLCFDTLLVIGGIVLAVAWRNSIITGSIFQFAPLTAKLFVPFMMLGVPIYISSHKKTDSKKRAIILGTMALIGFLIFTPALLRVVNIGMDKSTPTVENADIKFIGTRTGYSNARSFYFMDLSLPNNRKAVYKFHIKSSDYRRIKESGLTDYPVMIHNGYLGVKWISIAK